MAKKPRLKWAPPSQEAPLEGFSAVSRLMLGTWTLAVILRTADGKYAVMCKLPRINGVRWQQAHRTQWEGRDFAEAEAEGLAHDFLKETGLLDVVLFPDRTIRVPKAMTADPPVRVLDL